MRALLGVFFALLFLGCLIIVGGAIVYGIYSAGVVLYNIFIFDWDDVYSYAIKFVLSIVVVVIAVIGAIFFNGLANIMQSYNPEDI